MALWLSLWVQGYYFAYFWGSGRDDPVPSLISSVASLWGLGLTATTYLLVFKGSGIWGLGFRPGLGFRVIIRGHGLEEGLIPQLSVMHQLRYAPMRQDPDSSPEPCIFAEAPLSSYDY